MRVIMETGFDAIYLFTVVFLGILMVVKSKSNRQFKLFGIMAITLGCGDAFHLVPRMVALLTTGLSDYTVALGIGKWVTSVTMTVFYILLYYVWRIRYNVKGLKGLTTAIFGLSGIRVLLCFMPQNNWTDAVAPLDWAIYRNIPFAILGIIIIVLFFRSARRANDRAFKWMWLTIVLSFAFYIPVVLFADQYPSLGLLMIPKTCAYVWTILIGFNDMRRRKE